MLLLADQFISGSQYVENNADIEECGTDCNPRNILHAKSGTQNSPVAANHQESLVVPLLVALVKNELKVISKRNLKARNFRRLWKRVL
jgi:hypothetical protein